MRIPERGKTLHSGQQNLGIYSYMIFKHDPLMLIVLAALIIGISMAVEWFQDRFDK